MKLNKFLAVVLTAAMVLSTMSITAFAADREDPVFLGESSEQVQLLDAADEAELASDEAYGWTADTSWYSETATEFTLTTAEQLVGLAELVDGGNDFAGKTVKLGNSIDLYLAGDGEPVSFEPIGSYSFDKAFRGVFDGQGHTVSNMYQSGWALENGLWDGDDCGLGLFGLIENATIKNLKIDNADMPSEANLIGSVAGAAYEKCLFENITVTNTYMGNHSYYSGGIVGWASGNHRYINCDVDETTVISSQWGDFNNANGGIIGGTGKSGTYYLENCDVACVLDSFNDVTSAYEWYAYRNSGMLVGNTGRTVVDEEGTTRADASHITCVNCTVTYGEWANYTYCQFNAMGYPWVRVEAGESTHAYGNARYDYAVDANGNNVVDENHVHNDGEGHNVMLVLNQLFGGFQGGVYGTATSEGVTIIDNAIAARSVARIGEDYYETFAAAVAAAEENEVIELIADETIDETIEINKSITVNGNGNTLTGAGVVAPKTWDETGITPIKVVDGAVVNLTNIIVKGGSLINDAQYQPEASYGITGDAVVVENATLNVYDSELLGGDSIAADYTNSSGSAIVAVNSKINVENSVLANGRLGRNAISFPVIDADNYSYITLKNVTLDSADSQWAEAPIISSLDEAGDTAYHTNPVTVSGEIRVPGTRLSDVELVIPEGEYVKFIGNFDAEYISDTLEIVFKPANILDADGNVDTTAEEVADLYDIYVRGQAKFINRLNSADLTFLFDSTAADNAAMDYEIIPVEPVTITPHGENEDRYMFNFDGVTQPDDTAKEIKIAQAKITGYGTYTLSVNANAGENIVNATLTNDNIVEHFYVGGKASGDGDLILNNPAAIGTIAIPTRNLVINVAYPNAISANDKAYQQMTVTVTGPDYKEVLNLAAGNEDADTYNLRTADNGVVYYSTDDPTTDLVEGLALVLNTPYTVTVEGLGYRTAKYTVSMTEDKTLNFWNNVMDNDTYVEVAESGNKNAQKVTFLAGDIVKDNNINVYDLSAVVSYFGEIDLAEKGMNTYAKYDLNRDGKIDSKDVAYVLVSWGN